MDVCVFVGMYVHNIILERLEQFQPILIHI
jgi:hypothetical protein